MSTASAHNAFILAPETQGLWQLTLQVTSEGLKQLRDLLNWHGYPTGWRPFLYDRADERFPELVARTISYLRKPTTERIRQQDRAIERIADRRLRRYSFQLARLTAPPARLGTRKRRALAPARRRLEASPLYACYPQITLDHVTKLDFVSDKTHFQTWEARVSDGLVVYVTSLERGPLDDLLGIYSALKVDLASSVVRIFSPEVTLLEAYLPTARFGDVVTLFGEVHATTTWKPSIDEATDGRHIHAIRTIGICAEELIVSIFATLVRERAPAGPLGELLQTLESRVIKLLGRPQAGPHELDLSEVHRKVGVLIDTEKAVASPNQALLDTLISFQKVLLPGLKTFANRALHLERRFPEEHRLHLFPRFVQRAFTELVDLRNRVSHRNERGTSSLSVTHVDTATAMRAFAVAASWWHRERSALDFTKSPKEVAALLVDRSRQQDANGN